jgi:hypothetical protein
MSVQKIVDNADEDRSVYCHRVEPGSDERGFEFHEHGASAYELYVICTQAGEVLEVNHRVQHCPCGSRSFAPHGAPVHLFPAHALFDLEWEDIAPSARTYFLEFLSQITEAGPAKAEKERSRGRKQVRKNAAPRRSRR